MKKIEEAVAGELAKGNGKQEQQGEVILLHQKRSDTACIVGYAPSSKDLAPFGDKGVEIWGVNELYLHVPRVDVLFEMHDYSMLTTKKRNPKHLEWLRTAKIPIYMQSKFPDIPTSIEFPIKYLTQQFGNYFTNSISYMIAVAIVMRYKKLLIYGVDMATDIEYVIQRPSVEYFIGVAKGAGIDVVIPPEADIMRSPFLYGYDDERRSEIKLKMDAREKELTQRAQKLQQNIEAQAQQMHQLLGAADDVRYWKRTWVFRNKDETDVPK